MNDKIRFLFKAGLIVLALIIIQRGSGPTQKVVAKPKVLSGIEYFVDTPEKFMGTFHGTMGFVCGHESIDQYGNRSLDLLLRAGLDIKKILVVHAGDEHRVRQMFVQEHGFEVRSNLPIYFIDVRKQAKLGNVLGDIETIGVDIQLRGFCDDPFAIWLKKLLVIAAKKEKSVVIFDRPNPKGGIIAGGGRLPRRYGLTVAELARYFQRYEVPMWSHVYVVPMMGWQRNINVATSGFCDKKNEKSLTAFSAQSKYCCLYNPLPIIIKSERNKG